MRIAVIGAGVIGASTALDLVQDGHEVIVIERNDAPAQGASHANACLISPGHCFSWAEPGAVRAALKALFTMGEGFGICDPWRPSLWLWALLFAREASPDRWRENSLAAVALATLSRDLLFRDDHPVPPQRWAGRRNGILYLHAAGRNPEEDRLLQASGEPHVHFDRMQTLQQESFLAPASIAFEQSTFCPADATGDAARFTVEALEVAVALGAAVHYGTAVHGFELVQSRVVAVRTSAAMFDVDAVVVAAGLQSRELFRLLGHIVPIYPATGYSMTYRGVDALPSSAGVSLLHKVAWAPLDDSTLRLTGFADVGSPADHVVARRFEALEDFAQRLHPQLVGLQGTRWVGQRPMTPDSLPFLGTSAVTNVYANCGHGAMGWTLSAASARTITQLVRGQPADLDLVPFALDRFGRFGRRK